MQTLTQSNGHGPTGLPLPGTITCMHDTAIEVKRIY